MHQQNKPLGIHPKIDDIMIEINLWNLTDQLTLNRLSLWATMANKCGYPNNKRSLQRSKPKPSGELARGDGENLNKLFL
jgi:hypothetical protein